MKAVMCRELSGLDGLTFEDVSPPIAGPGDVVVSARACGVNFPDSLITLGDYQVRPQLPFSPGLELAGVISIVGEGVEGLVPGMRVAAHPLFGAFAEEVRVPANRVFPIPDSLDYVTAAGFLINYGTSYNALKSRGHLMEGETLLVLGAAGGVGLAAVELGVAMGARVIAAASTDEKLQICSEHGAHELVNYATEDLRERVSALTAGRGIDVVYDPVGGDLAEPMVRALAHNGRYLIIGFASGTIPRIPLNLPLLKLTSLVGVHWGPWLDAEPAQNAVNMQEVFEFYATGALRPHVSATYPLAEAADAISHVAGRRSVGKVVLTVDEPFAATGGEIVRRAASDVQ